MGIRFTYEDEDGTSHLKTWALPAIIVGILVPVIGSFAVTSQGAAIGFALAALSVLVILVLAARSKPFKAMEVADADGPGHRVLVLALGEVDHEAAARIAELSHGVDDLRVVVPTRIKTLDRWFDGSDGARAIAQDRLARSAGALTAEGLPVSGAVGDDDPIQAVADELRSFAADEVLVVPGDGREAKIEKLRHQLALPLTTV